MSAGIAGAMAFALGAAWGHFMHDDYNKVSLWLLVAVFQSLLWAILRVAESYERN